VSSAAATTGGVRLLFRRFQRCRQSRLVTLLAVDRFSAGQMYLSQRLSVHFCSRYFVCCIIQAVHVVHSFILARCHRPLQRERSFIQHQVSTGIYSRLQSRTRGECRVSRGNAWPFVSIQSVFREISNIRENRGICVQYSFAVSTYNVK
jgi:hypothetical protein